MIQAPSPPDSLAAELMPQAPPVAKAQPRRNGNGSPRPADGDGDFDRVNKIDTVEVLDRLGIDHETRGEKELATCPGCGEAGALVCKDGGIKCLHNRCADAGPPSAPGFRSNVDLVVAVNGGEPAAAVKWLAEKFNVALNPKRTDATPEDPMPPDDAPDPTDDDDPRGPPPIKDSVKVESVNGIFTPATAPREPLTIASIVTRWRDEGPVVRLSTGIAGIDRLSHGGLPAIRRTAIVGAPTAGKTYLAACIAHHHLTHHRIPVGWLGVDEDPDDIAIRFGQMHGFLLHDLESCAPAALDGFEEALRDAPLRLFDATYTIEAAATALRAEYPDGPATLIIDSIQTVASALAGDARSPRELVEAAVRSVRAVQYEHRLGVFFTSEANRASYRNDDAADTTNDLAAGAESRALEYGAQTQLMLRTPKDHPDVVRVRIAKNRRADRGEFWIHLLRPAHDLEECGDPTSTPEAKEEREQEARARVSEAVRRDAADIARLVQRQPGIGTRQLRDALRIAGHKWGPERVGAAMTLLESGDTGVRLVNRGEQGRGQACAWHLEPIQDWRRDGDDE